MGESTKEAASMIENVRSVVFKQSESLEDTCAKINGYDFNQGVNYSQILKSLVSTGFQASNLGDAIEIVNQMLEWRLSHEEVTEDCSEEEKNMTYRESVRCKIFLGFTSNLVSSGVRDIIRYLVQHHMVEVIVTTTGGIEEDIIKCLADTYKGDFSLPGAALRSKGLNRIGNLLVPNENYCKFEDWIIPIFDQMLEEQKTQLAGNEVVGLLFVALAHALVVGVMISAGFRISGGHLNPAVTIGLCAGGHITVVRSLFYWIDQLLASVAACALLSYLTGGLVNFGNLKFNS